MNTTKNATDLALVQAELAAGLICISDQMTRLDQIIAHGEEGCVERRNLWRMEIDQAGMALRRSTIVDRIALNEGPSAVLVVEDDALLLMSAIADLEAAGFTVIDAANADEALALLETRDSIAAVFTDVQMPGTMDGLALMRLVHTRWPLIKMIVTSGNMRIGPDDLALGDQFLRKPYLAEDLVTALRTN
jgi:CheY-like chemotaxis protein